MKYNLAKEFSTTPFGRDSNDGKNSGERFRPILIELLNTCKKNNEQLTIDLDDVPIGIGSSFLDEGFAGVVRCKAFTEKQFHKLTIIKSIDVSYIEEINEYVNDAENGR